MSDQLGSIFQEAFGLASEAIDDVMGECWTYQPMAKGDANGRSSQDPERAPASFTAVYLDPFARAGAGPERKPGLRPEHPGHASSRPVCDLALCRLPYAPRAGDRLVRRQTCMLYEVAEARPNGVGRAALDLNVLGKA
jgi:hypothetical protein